MPHSLSQAPVFNNMDYGSESTAKEKIKVLSLMTKRNTESVELEKWLKKAIAGDFLCASGEVILFVDSKVS